jgi:hypothetical protein
MDIGALAKQSASLTASGADLPLEGCNDPLARTASSARFYCVISRAI